MPSSREVNWVCRPSSRAAIWSIDTAACTSAPAVSLYGTQVRNVPAEREWSPPPLTLLAASSSRPPHSRTRSFRPESERRIGGSASSGPSCSDDQNGMDMPLGT